MKKLLECQLLKLVCFKTSIWVLCTLTLVEISFSVVLNHGKIIYPPACECEAPKCWSKYTIYNLETAPKFRCMYNSFVPTLKSSQKNRLCVKAA